MEKDILQYAEKLTHIGLSLNESLTYCYGLKFPRMSISSLSRMTHIARSTLYGVVRQLLKKGLLLEYRQKGTTEYSSVSFDEMMKIVESEKQKIADQLSRLEDEKEFFSPLEGVYEHKSTPTVTHYSSSEIMPIMYDKISESDFVRSIWDITGAMKYYSMSYEEISLLSRSARGTTHRILVDTQEAHQYKKDHPEEELRLVADSALSLSDEFMMDGVVYHGRYDHNHTGIAITDDTYYRVQCYLFDTLWNSL